MLRWLFNLSIKVREWLKRMSLLHLTDHDDRIEIDKEIESWTGSYCDEAINKRLISENEFKKIVRSVLDRKRSKVTTPLIV